jgi:hypothetical protein
MNPSEFVLGSGSEDDLLNAQFFLRLISATRNQSHRGKPLGIKEGNRKSYSKVT